MSKYVVDTFCFYWAGIHSYVLVRVLQQSIALLPLQSRAAFLFFHQAQHDITLENVLNDCHATQWKQCQCEVDGSRFDQHIVLTTPHSSFKLTARSFTEKMMFLNLFKFNHQNTQLKEQHDYKNV
jgi:hypothetical protein